MDGNDPIGFGGGSNNLFRYCFNDPVNYTDSNGFKPFHVKLGSSYTIAQWSPGWSYDFVEGKIDYGDSVALNTLIGGGWDLTITGPCPDAVL